MKYLIKITEASGDVSSTHPVEAESRQAAEAIQTENWNANHAHTDRYKSELFEDGELINTIGGWDEDDD